MEEDHNATVNGMHFAPLAMPPAELKPEPTAVIKLEPAMMPAPEWMPKSIFILEPEPDKMPDQVHELAILSVPKDILVEYEGVVWSPVPSAKADISALNSAPLIIFEEMESISSLEPTNLLLEPTNS